MTRLVLDSCPALRLGLRSFATSATPAPSVRRVGAILNAPADEIVGSQVTVRGWLRTARAQKRLQFLHVHDGSALATLQVVVPEGVEVVDEDPHTPLPDGVARGGLTTGTAVVIEGRVVESPGKGQSVEIEATKVAVVGACDTSDYPLQKKRHSRDTLRRMPHLRPRTNTFAAVARVRSALALATHQYFQEEEGFLFVQTPLITSLDCEGAGEMFTVGTTAAATADAACDDGSNSGAGGDTDADSDAESFFGRQAYLTVSGQLTAESFACSLGNVYTFGPTFRAEQSHGTRHLAEFHMVEPELAFATLDDVMASVEGYVKHCASHVLARCGPEVAFFDKFIEPGLEDRLGAVARGDAFARVTYGEAVAMLRDAIEEDPSKWQHADLAFGDDLKTEHERWLAEEVFKGPTFVYNYPASLKPFYMRENGDLLGKGAGGEESGCSSGGGSSSSSSSSSSRSTVSVSGSGGGGGGGSYDPATATVAAVDLIVPGMGELAGGSAREERYNVLRHKMRESGLCEEEYGWYLDLRRFGTVPHGGYGVGFERLVCFCTGIPNIRDAIAYPRFPGSLDF